MRGLIVALLSLSLGGCAWLGGLWGGEDNVEPPAQLEDFESSLRVQTLWSTRIGVGTAEQFVKLVPTVADGKVFAADRKGRVVAVEAETGRPLWETATEAPLSGGPGSGEGLVLVGSSEGEVIALRAEDGAIAWRTPVSSEILSVPQAENGVVVVHAVDGRVSGLDARDGKRLWTYDRTVPALSLRGGSSPVLAQGYAVGGFASGKLASLDLRDGRLVWETSIAVPSGRSELERLVDINADPVIVDGIVYVVTFQGRIAAVDLASGRTLWVRDLSSYAGLAVDGRRLYVTDDQSNVWALDSRNGASLWRQEKLHARILTGPTVYDDAVVVGDFEGYLHWLSREDGSFLARVRVDKEGILTPPVVVDDTLYVLGEGGTLAALRAE